VPLLPLDPTDRAQASAFLRLPFRLYQNTPPWVPPFAGDARRMLDRQRHPFYRHSQAAFFLALGGEGQPVGRIAVLDHRPYNDHNHQRTAFFYLFECENDPEPAQALFEAAFAWARARGLDRIIGPRGFTALDGLGLLVRGFEHRPALGIPYNPAYYPALIEAAGFTAAKEDTLGELELGIYFGQVESDGYDDVSAVGWGGDRLRLYQHVDGRAAIVWFSVWDTEGAAIRAEEAATRVRTRADAFAAPLQQVVRKGRAVMIARGLPPELHGGVADAFARFALEFNARRSP